jgi:hypothetical protein
MRLCEWQERFQSAMLGARPRADLPLRGAGLPRELSIDIYAYAYRERLHEALRSNYGALHRLLGDRDFAEMAYAFTAAHPPRTVSIRWFGADLPLYLRTVAPFFDCAVLAELAQFEWALRHTIDAAEGERIDADFLRSLSATQWETLRCAMHPSLSVLHFAWNAPPLWCALDNGGEPPAPTQCGAYWFVYRDANLVTQWRSAETTEALAMQRWQRGDDFSAICNFLAARDEHSDAAIKAAELMRCWVDQGLLIHPLNN